MVGPLAKKEPLLLPSSTSTAIKGQGPWFVNRRQTYSFTRKMHGRFYRDESLDMGSRKKAPLRPGPDKKNDAKAGNSTSYRLESLKRQYLERRRLVEEDLSRETAYIKEMEAQLLMLQTQQKQQRAAAAPHPLPPQPQNQYEAPQHVPPGAGNGGGYAYASPEHRRRASANQVPEVSHEDDDDDGQHDIYAQYYHHLMHQDKEAPDPQRIKQSNNMNDDDDDDDNDSTISTRRLFLPPPEPPVPAIYASTPEPPAASSPLKNNHYDSHPPHHHHSLLLPDISPTSTHTQLLLTPQPPSATKTEEPSPNSPLRPRLDPSRVELQRLSICEIGKVLRKNNLGLYEEEFHKNCVDGETLSDPTLTDQDLLELGVKIRLHRKRLLDLIRRYKSQGVPLSDLKSGPSSSIHSNTNTQPTSCTTTSTNRAQVFASEGQRPPQNDKPFAPEAPLPLELDQEQGDVVVVEGGIEGRRPSTALSSQGRGGTRDEEGEEEEEEGLHGFVFEFDERGGKESLHDILS